MYDDVSKGRTFHFFNDLTKNLMKYVVEASALNRCHYSQRNICNVQQLLMQCLEVLEELHWLEMDAEAVDFS